MALGLGEIRDQAERLKSAIARERYQARAGLKGRSELAAIYREHGLLTGSEVLPTIQRELARATGDRERRLRTLLAWVADQQVEAALAPLEDEYRGWETGSSVPLGEREISLREVLPTLENEPSREVRLELERRRNLRLEEALPLQVDTLHREREAIADLGFGPFVEARERLSGLNVRGLEREAVRILAASEEGYRNHLKYLARNRIGVAPDALDRSDARWLGRMEWLDGHFRLHAVLDGTQRDLAELGLPLRPDGQVTLDLESRPLKARESFSAPIHIPDEIVLVVSPAGGWADCRSLLHEVGHTLHFAYTGQQLPFEYRVLGDTSVTETYAVLFERLVLDSTWVERRVDLSARELGDYQRVAGFVQLFRLRALAAMLIYELELYDADMPGEMGGRYAEIMTGATGFRFDERTYLQDVARGFWVARRLRAWMLGAILRTVLRDRYDVDWFRNPAAGPYLGELLSCGQRDDAGQLAVQLGAERLNADLLLRQVAGWLS